MEAAFLVIALPIQTSPALLAGILAKYWGKMTYVGQADYSHLPSLPSPGERYCFDSVDNALNLAESAFLSGVKRAIFFAPFGTSSKSLNQLRKLFPTAQVVHPLFASSPLEAKPFRFSVHLIPLYSEEGPGMDEALTNNLLLYSGKHLIIVPKGAPADIECSTPPEEVERKLAEFGSDSGPSQLRISRLSYMDFPPVDFLHLLSPTRALEALKAVGPYAHLPLNVVFYVSPSEQGRYKATSKVLEDALKTYYTMERGDSLILEGERLKIA